MPAPPVVPTDFGSILEQVWWRLDCALDLEMLAAAARLGALEALEVGTTCVIDHHEGPNAIEGSLDVIAAACAEVGVRVNCTYGVSDRHPGAGPIEVTPQPSANARPTRMTDGARRGLVECERFIRGGGRGMVGVHAAFTCADDTLEAATGLASDLGVGVHIHVAEGPGDASAGSRLESMCTDEWLIVHGVHLDRDLPGTLAHNPRSNMNNAVGYARPAQRSNRVVLGTDGIGADMLDEFRVAYAKHRESDVTASPDTAWSWLTNSWKLFPEALSDEVTWSYDTMEPWHLAFTTGVRPLKIVMDGRTVLDGGVVTTVDPVEVRAKANEQARRLFRLL